MSSGVVRSAIASIIDHPDFSMKSEKFEITKKLAILLLDTIVEDESGMKRFNAFSSTLLPKIQATSTIDKSKSYSCGRESAWSVFYSLPGKEQKLCHPLLFHRLKDLFYLITCIVYRLYIFFFLGFCFCRVHTFALAISYLCILCLAHELL